MRNLALGLLLVFFSQTISTPSHAESGGTLKISPKVWGWYQDYTRLIGASNPGAFAVSRDGRSAYGFYCEDILCGGGPSYKRVALERCKSMAHQDCIIFAYARAIQVPYTVMEDDPDDIIANLLSKISPAPEPAPKPAAIVVDPPFESPLADGTIVLSHTVATALEKYLSTATSQASAAYFFVSPDGRHFGAFSCVANGSGEGGLPACPYITSWSSDHVDNRRAAKNASGACSSNGGKDCVLLFSGDSRKADYKLLK